MTDEKNKTPAGDRIAKVLARAGIASRREAEKIIEAGRVTVNGKTILTPALNVTGRDRIVVDGKELAEPEAPRIWIYHKPAGLVTTERDEKGRDTVFDALPKDMPRVMSVGRLDINSEGLLLLTNDGDLKRTMELPATGWLRRYRVRIKGSLSEAKLDELRAGIEVDGVRYAGVEVKFDRQQGANAWLTMGLREGKNREIRRLMEAQGVIVNRLLRISYGPFQLGTLKPGAVEEVKQRIVRDQMGLRDAPKPSRPVPKGKRPPPKRGTAASAKRHTGVSRGGTGGKSGNR
ncbi:pseudouridine synthase [Octadecabacter sp. 1_MG-2023]|uniref:pseudouridine synthase n=1 Tax=unclassified Octadecabacter TaxID=196158 RepID=UPI001C0A637F|nr:MULTISPECIES: pseudouridine synthase [unclassified Octadecabacter]MBU2992706.1 rRNA pseudouridine synthase [Octadecabacter sp. B2R22]MDO6733843.1 pseudouridine synthase [Octadecabacter sp. 1_MG-2023]